MSTELHAEERGRGVSAEPEAVEEPPSHGRRHPNVSGDLTAVFDAAPMFRRTVAGYDRYQVDTYVQWAEDELATADREREHLLGRHLATRAELDEARQLLAHSSSGAEFLTVSHRIGSMLAAAADEAESLRGEAAAERSAAAAEAARLAADAERMLTEAAAEARRLVDGGVAEAEQMVAAATERTDQLFQAAEQAGRDARADAEARLQQARLVERNAAEQAEQILQRARAEASAALVQARAEVVRMLSTGREERRRADAEASATRERADRETAARAAYLRAEVEALEQRRALLLAEVGQPAASTARRPGDSLDVSLRRLGEHLRLRPRSLRLP